MIEVMNVSSVPMLSSPMSSTKDAPDSGSEHGHFRKLRRDNPSKILVNLCIALTLSNLIFVAGMHPYALDNMVGCKIVAVLLHFSLLSALCWMAVEAFYMYLALVLVFKTYFTNFILKCSLIGWGIPLVIVVITLGVNETDNYGPLNSGICWLSGVSFYAAFLAPVCLILLVNFLAFGLVLRQILGLAQRKLNKSDSFSTAQQLRGAVGVAILLGLTWAFALFAIDKASVVFYYLFAIFNSLQGLWIFVFYCLLKKEARSAWRRALPCCHSMDDKSMASNTRDNNGQYSLPNHSAGYSGAATKTDRSKSSTDNGTTTSTAFTTSSTSDSEAVYENVGKAVNGQKPAMMAGAVEANDVHIKLSDNSANHVYSNNVNNAQPPAPDQPTRTVYRSEGNIVLPTVVNNKGGSTTPTSTAPKPPGSTAASTASGNHNKGGNTATATTAPTHPGNLGSTAASTVPKSSTAASTAPKSPTAASTAPQSPTAASTAPKSSTAAYTASQHVTTISTKPLYPGVTVINTKASSSISKEEKSHVATSPEFQPLRFTVGYTLSNASTVSSGQQSDVDPSTNNSDDSSSQPSVTDLIKKMNNTKI